MSFWGIFIHYVFIAIIVIMLSQFIYSIIKANNKIKFWGGVIIFIEASLLIGYLLFCSYLSKNTFDNVVKNSYYKGVSVKVIPKINSDYKIERMDSVFYINE